MPDPEWSFTLSEATVTLDDYARMKDVSFRAGTVPLLYTPYLIWPTKEDRASGMLVPGIGYSNQRGGYLGLSYYWVTGRPTDVTTQLDAYTDGSIGVGQRGALAADRRVGGPLPGLRDPRPGRHGLRAALARPRPAAATASARCPTARSASTRSEPETRWKLRLDHVADDLPFGFRGVLSIRDYSDQQYLQDFERSFALNSARQIVSRGFLTKNFGSDSLNIRFERSETFYSSTVLQERFPTRRVLPPHGADRPDSPFYLSLLSSLSGALHQPRARTSPRGTYGRFDVYPIFSLPWKSIPWLSLTARAGGRFTEYTDSTRRRGAPTFNGNVVHPDLRARPGSRSWARPSPASTTRRSAPADKFKHVIEPRVDYSYVSNVDDPDAHPGLRRGRQRARPQPGPLRDRQPAARALGRGSRAPRRRSRRSRSRRPTRSSSRRRSSRSRREFQTRKTGPVRGHRSGCRGPASSTSTGGVSYDPYANQLTSATVTAGSQLEAQLRQRQLVRQPARRRRRRAEVSATPTSSASPAASTSASTSGSTPRSTTTRSRTCSRRTGRS